MSYSTDNTKRPEEPIKVLREPLPNLWPGIRVIQGQFVGSFKHYGRKLKEDASHYRASFSERRVLLAVLDTLLIIFAIVAADPYGQFIGQPARWLWPVALLGGWGVFASLHDLYDIPSSCNRMVTVLRLLAVGSESLVLFFLAHLLWPQLAGQQFFLYFLPIALLSILLWRLAYTSLSPLIAAPQRILILGAEKRGQAIAQLLQQVAPMNYQVLGYVDELPAAAQGDAGCIPVLGALADLPRLVQQLDVDEVVVAVDQDVTDDHFQVLVGCLARGVQVSPIPLLYERLCKRIPVQHIEATWALSALQGKPILNRMQRFSKRALDLFIVLASLPIMGLLLPLLALAVRLDSPGPVFYRQMRCARAGRPFSIIKFRTMVVDAEKDGRARWATENDPRITRVGRFLRKTRLDELPQLINILKGDMSIVGPRPERPEFVEDLQKVVPFYQVRLMVKPGLTGWAQIHYDYGNSVEDALLKLQYDFYYIRYWSLWLDIYTIFKTVYVVLRFKGL